MGRSCEGSGSGGPRVRGVPGPAPLADDGVGAAGALPSSSAARIQSGDGSPAASNSAAASLRRASTVVDLGLGGGQFDPRSVPVVPPPVHDPARARHAASWRRQPPSRRVSHGLGGLDPRPRRGALGFVLRRPGRGASTATSAFGGAVPLPAPLRRGVRAVDSMLKPPNPGSSSASVRVPPRTAAAASSDAIAARKVCTIWSPTAPLTDSPFARATFRACATVFASSGGAALQERAHFSIVPLRHGSADACPEFDELLQAAVVGLREQVHEVRGCGRLAHLRDELRPVSITTAAGRSGEFLPTLHERRPRPGIQPRRTSSSVESPAVIGRPILRRVTSTTRQ